MRKTRIAAFVVMAFAILAFAHAAEAQQPKHVPRLGFLSAPRLTATSPGSWVCSKGYTRWAMWRGQISSSSGGMRQDSLQSSPT